MLEHYSRGLGSGGRYMSVVELENFFGIRSWGCLLFVLSEERMWVRGKYLRGIMISYICLSVVSVADQE